MKSLVLFLIYLLVHICSAESPPYATQSIHVPSLNGTVYIVANLSAPHIHKSHMDRMSDFILMRAANDDPNPIAGQVFDTIADDYVHYSKYIANAPISTILELRQSLLAYYTDLHDYAEAASRLDRFVEGFRPDTSSFDIFAYVSIDFLLQPILGARDFPSEQLAQLRTEIIQSIPATATTAQKSDFIAYMDSVISTFPNGGNLAPYITNA